MQLWNKSGDRKALFELMCDEHVRSQVCYVQKDRTSKPTCKIGSSSFCVIVQNKRSENITYLAELTSTANFVFIFNSHWPGLLWIRLGLPYENLFGLFCRIFFTGLVSLKRFLLFYYHTIRQTPDDSKDHAYERRTVKMVSSQLVP